MNKPKIDKNDFEYLINRIALICDSHSQPAITRLMEIKEEIREFKNENTLG